MATVPDTPGTERLPVPASGRPHPAHQSEMRTLRFNWARLVGYDFFISFKLGTFDEGVARRGAGWNDLEMAAAVARVDRHRERRSAGRFGMGPARGRDLLRPPA